MIIDCISDLHGNFPKLEGGDLLIVAGDLTARDTEKQNEDFWRWVAYQDYKKMIVIAGNHDNYMKNHPNSLVDEGKTLEYLCDSGTEFCLYPHITEVGKTYERQKVKIWGSPWTKTFEGINPHCTAFTLENEEDLQKKWDLIPKDTDILITHSPPFGILDNSFGSTALRSTVEEIKPRLHVFGHIHEGSGQTVLKHVGPNTICVNASYVDRRYRPVNKPIRIEL